MIRVGITGVPGSGKTTMARALSSTCREINGLSRVELVSEYARRYVSKHGPVESMWEQYRILQKQCEWEDSVVNDKLDLMVTDSPVFLGFLYCNALPRETSKDIMCWNDVFKALSKLNFPTSRYDLVFHLSPKLSPVDDGIRLPEHLEDDWREQKNSEIVTITKDIFPPKRWILIDTIDQSARLETCIKIIKEEL